MRNALHERFFLTFNVMSIRYLVAVTASLFILNNASAQAKAKFAKSGKSYASIVSATMQRTIPGMRGAQPIINYTFKLKWKSKEVPETFFWRGTNTWMNCATMVYKTTKNKTNEKIELENIKPGCYIELSAMPGGKFPMPEEIQNTKGQNIFFKTANSGWRYLPVTNITKKKDLAMP